MNVLLRGLSVFFTLCALASTAGGQVVKGNYNGLFFEANEVNLQSSGSFSISTATSRAFTGKLILGGANISVKGTFDLSGIASVSVPRKNLDPLRLDLQLSPDAQHITGTLSNQAWTAELSGDLAVFNSKTNVAPQAGRYTMVIPGTPGSTSEPAGDGYGTVSVDSAGRVSLAGALADGTKITQGSVISGDGRWPLYIPLYGNKGMILGWITFANEPASDLSGDLNWIKPADVKSKYYPGGFTNEPAVSGLVYLPPPKGSTILGMISGAVVFEEGNLVQSFTNHFLLDDLNRGRNLSANTLTMEFTPSTGAFRGKANDPVTQKTVSFGGVVLQEENTGAGFFSDVTLCGPVHFGPEVADIVEFQTIGSSFSADVQVNGTPEIFRWLWADGTSSATYPVVSKKLKKGKKRQFLVASPPGSLKSVNIGFDGSDGGTNTPLTFRAQQNVSAVYFPYPLTGLQYWASSQNPLVTLDFTGFDSVEVIECFECTKLQHVTVTNLPSLKRACFEDCDLQELDLSGNPAFEDLRAALNRYNSIIVGGGTGPNVWHWCTRDNQQLGQDFRDILPLFPSLRELWNWGDKQSGSFPVFSTNLTDVQAESNFYTDADFSGQGNLIRCWLYNNSLTNLVLDGCTRLEDVDVHNNQLTGPVLDNILLFLESVVTNAPDQVKFVDLTGNPGRPSAAGYAAYANILSHNVSIHVDDP